ncbi:DUF5681 domain-containing protein [Croceicoccus bisphenolivorans]|uniref:DUF5681 domain-containing protein n=1 Tax=Croceicoccus bisphenolivorans TaxID=1783232 RepID=UPI0008314CC4|nr:DUF5681 domain-containing protein [Croceicoccus bisphenolivorans]
MAKAPARKRTSTRKAGASNAGSPQVDAAPVGPGNPPVAHRFKPGQSGNPAGRPKMERSMLKHVEKELDTEMQIREGDEVFRLTKREVLAKRMVNSALGGDAKAITALMRLLGTATDSNENATATVPLESVMNFLARRMPTNAGDEA